MALSSVALASGPTPNLGLAERGGFALIQQSLGIVAGIIDHTTCSDTKGVYTFAAYVNYIGEGVAYLDDLDIHVVNTTTPGQSFRGTLLTTTIPVAGEVDDTIVAAEPGQPAGATNVGSFGYPRFGDILYGDTQFTLDGDSFDQHTTKDLYLGTVFGSASGVRDDGLEIVTKSEFPRAKWRQTSQFRRPNGSVGQLSVVRDLIAPDGSALCTIRLIDAVVDDAGDGFQMMGDIEVDTTLSLP